LDEAVAAMVEAAAAAATPTIPSAALALLLVLEQSDWRRVRAEFLRAASYMRK
jgi:hypothetical protein